MALALPRKDERLGELSVDFLGCMAYSRGSKLAEVMMLSKDREGVLPAPGVPERGSVAGYVGTRLPLVGFRHISGMMAGTPFVKVVVERASKKIHFIDNDQYAFHVDYIAEQILHIKRDEIRKQIDDFNEKVYLSPDRDFYLGIVSLQENGESFFALETVEIDNMDTTMLMEFFHTVKDNLDPVYPLVFKPANHTQESIVGAIDHFDLPRVYNHELFASKHYVPLNAGEATGRLRHIKADDYKILKDTIEWYDIIVMDRVPDSIPRVSGIINSQHTTPLSHTNVLACGWQIPNAIEIGVIKDIAERNLDGKWVSYKVGLNNNHIQLEEIAEPADRNAEKPNWSVHAITLEEPEITNLPIVPLDRLRMSDRSRYGTKAANLGELYHVLRDGSSRLSGFYRVPRPPRDNLLSYLAGFLGARPSDDLNEAAANYLRRHIKIPRGIAIPFSFQEEFLEASPKIQQAIGKLKMALELEVKEIDSLCLLLQSLIRKTKMSDKLRDQIDDRIAEHLAGVSSFVVRSSSNAEDLKDFSAAGIYESMNHVTTADTIFQSIKEVWASLVSPRSVRLRQQVGISLDECYMGVIVQEEVESDMGGVLVTTNPMSPKSDFRNVFINASGDSAVEVVEGAVLPHQYLYNTMEGGGRTLSIGNSKEDFPLEKKAILEPLAYSGRLLQSHFSQNYTFSEPVDIEWATNGSQIFILQLRPYAV